MRKKRFYAPNITKKFPSADKETADYCWNEAIKHVCYTLSIDDPMHVGEHGFCPEEMNEYEKVCLLLQQSDWSDIEGLCEYLNAGLAFEYRKCLRWNAKEKNVRPNSK
jgi:hypothetical protein